MRDSETVIQMPPPGSPRPQRPVLRYLLYAIGGIIAAIVLVWAVLYITKGRFLKDPVERIASRLTGRTVNVEGDFQRYFNPIDITKPETRRVGKECVSTGKHGGST